MSEDYDDIEPRVYKHPMCKASGKNLLQPYTLKEKHRREILLQLLESTGKRDPSRIICPDCGRDIYVKLEPSKHGDRRKKL